MGKHPSEPQIEPTGQVLGMRKKGHFQPRPKLQVLAHKEELSEGEGKAELRRSNNWDYFFVSKVWYKCACQAERETQVG